MYNIPTDFFFWTGLALLCKISPCSLPFGVAQKLHPMQKKFSLFGDCTYPHPTPVSFQMRIFSKVPSPLTPPGSRVQTVTGVSIDTACSRLLGRKAHNCNWTFFLVSQCAQDCALNKPRLFLISFLSSFNRPRSLVLKEARSDFPLGET